MASSPPDHGLVKLQVTGPATLATALEGPGRGALAAEISGWLAANARAQVQRLRELGLRAVLIVDEPGLDRAGIPDPRLYDPLRATGAAAWGVHVCGPVPWALVDALEVDVLSFDAVRHPPDAAVLDRIIARGGRIAWGVVDPVAPVEPAAIAARVAVPAANSMLTPTCGTGVLSPAKEAQVARALAQARAARFMHGQSS
jgi:hypothetical protein